MDVDLPGSSPLARGLPRRRVGVRPAGQDHPRSRGVYGGAAALGPVGPGSSPLARGLLHGICVSIKETGIILARAGFTHGPLLRVSHHGDHPRSRGVYVAVHDSVLAHEMDHPRSRGVYRGSTSLLTPLLGSSPLARGLPQVWCCHQPRSRIIPARAGFTGSPPRPGGPRGDHPRSRGVYFVDGRVASVNRGSSPLARGLRSLPQGAYGGRGIIPARAGFTPVPPGRLPVELDHPRSRGVYPAPTPTISPAAGSSPLARGLLGQVGEESGERGIIPARAGFTCAAGASCRTCTDHPRSRGVYAELPPGRAWVLGSSPLARGLLRRRRVREGLPGIIPARAGFTTPTPRPPPGRGDHPRSRGVYGHAKCH